MEDTARYQTNVTAEHQTPSDVEDFVGLATTLDSVAWPSLRGFLVSYYPLVIARAPGSLAVLDSGVSARNSRNHQISGEDGLSAAGRHDQNSGEFCCAQLRRSQSLYLPLAEAALVAVQRADDRMLAVAKVPDQADDMPQVLVITMGELEDLAARPYADLRARFAGHSWMAAVAGSLVALHREFGRWIGESWRVLIRSHVPARGDCGSSAALEVAAVQALVNLLDQPLEGRELAHLCRIVETEVLGMPGSGAAQWTAALGRQDHLLAIDSDDVAFVPLPPSVRLWGIALGDAAIVPPAAEAVNPAVACPAAAGSSADHVERFCRLLAGPLNESTLAELGQLLESPHTEDFRAGGCSADTDLLLQQLRAAGPARGLYGVRRSGPGDRTFIVLARSDAAPVVQEMAAHFAAQSGSPVRLVSGSSAGVCAFGCVRL